MSVTTSRCLLAIGLTILTSSVTGLSALQGRTPTQGPISDPIPDDPRMSRLGLVVKEVASFPSSEPVPPPIDARMVRRARINYLGEIPDGSHRRYVPDLNGTLYVLQGDAPQPYLDVRAAVGANFFSGRGLGSGFGFVTFHPDFKRNGKFYSVHTEAFGALTNKTPDLTAQPKTIVHGVITEWTANNPSANSFVGTHREVLRLGFASYIHGIQQIDFNPTAEPNEQDYALLYIAVGDGGIGVSSGDPQNLAVPQGKILRIDPLGTGAANGKYGIPPSNPFVGKSGALGEIYAYGMRDPHRFSWDPAGRHRMFLAHIGEKDIEAIYDVTRAGTTSVGASAKVPSPTTRPTGVTSTRCRLTTRRIASPILSSRMMITRLQVIRGGADVGHVIKPGGFCHRGDVVRAYQASTRRRPRRRPSDVHRGARDAAWRGAGYKS